MAMYRLEVYYLNHAGRGLTHSGGSAKFIQPYSTYSVGMASAIFSAVSFVGSDPYCGAGPNSGGETLRTGGKILTDIADNKSPEVTPRISCLNK